MLEEIIVKSLTIFPFIDDKFLIELSHNLELDLKTSNLEPFFSQFLSNLGQTDLQFLVNFSQLIEEKYLLQLRKDYANFSPGLQLLENLINSVRGITEIDQAQRDRRFQAIVGIISMGLAASAITASLSGQFPNVVSTVRIIEGEEAQTTVNQSLGDVVTNLKPINSGSMPINSLILSLLIGLLFASLTGVLIGIWGFIGKIKNKINSESKKDD